MAAALGARGAISKLAGDTAANRAYTYSDAQKLENDAARRAALAINEHGVVPASYYNTQSEMTKTKSRGKQE
jgi:hypothetical protein